MSSVAILWKIKYSLFLWVTVSNIGEEFLLINVSTLSAGMNKISFLKTWKERYDKAGKTTISYLDKAVFVVKRPYQHKINTRFCLLLVRLFKKETRAGKRVAPFSRLRSDRWWQTNFIISMQQSIIHLLVFLSAQIKSITKNCNRIIV